MPNNQITFGINFTSDSTQLKNIQQNLLAIKNMSAEIGQKLISSGQFKGTEAELEKIKTMAGQVNEVFEKTFNPALGTANSLKVNQGLKEMGLSLSDVQTGFASLGTAGQFVFSQVRGGMAGLNYQLKEAHPLLKKIAEDFGKTFTWGIYSRVMNRIVGSIQTAYSFVQKLDTSLNNIRIVTGKSSEEMAKFAVQANKAAKSLGANTVDYTNASLIYYQQGLSDAEVRARTEVTVKVANITKQSANEVSEQLTAVWNGYRVSAEEAELYIDKLSAVAASTASDLEELSTAMSKVASAAATMGVDIDQLTAQISTIVSVTRQDAANVGTALKTIYARMGDLLVAGDAVDEFGVSLGDVSGQMAIMGINILDQQGNMRDLGTVIEEVAAKWETWTSAQQQAAAVALAGKRQYNNLIALFNNWDMYESALETSQTSEGTLQKQQDTYMESLEAHLEKLSAAGERLYNSLFDSDSFKSLLDVLTFLVDRVGDFVDAIGGGGQALQYLGSILVAVFSAQLSKNILAFANNLTVSRKNTEAYKNALNDLNQAQRAYQMGVGSATAVDYHKDVLNDTKRAATFQMAARKGILNQDEAAALMGQETALQQSRQKVFAAQLTLENMGGSEEDQRTLKEALDAAKQGKLTEGQLARVQGIDFGQVTASAKEKYDSAIKKLMGANTLKKGEKWEGHISEDEFNKMSFESDEEAQEFKREWVDTSDNRNRYNASVYKTWKSQKKEITAAAKELTSLDQVSEATKNRITAALDAIQGKGKPTQDQIDELNKAMEAGFTEAGAAGEKLADAVNNINKSTRELTEKEKAVQQQMLGQVFMQLASAATLAFQAIKSIISVLSDQNLSGVEKVNQIVMTLIGILPALIPIILGIKTSLKTLNMSLKELWGLVWPIALAIAALVATIFAIVAIFDAINKKEHQAAEAAKEANQAYEEQKTALNEVKNAYEELKQSIEDYHDAQSAIDELIVGTQEWKDAIYEANQQVLDLINAYPELAKYVSTDQNGRMTISQEGLDLQLEKQQQAIQEQQARVANAKILKNQADQAAKAEEVRNLGTRGLSWDRTWAVSAFTGPLVMAAMAIGSAASYKQNLSDQQISDISNKIVDGTLTTDQEIQKRLSSLGVDEDLIDELTVALKENAAAIEKNNSVNAVLGRQIAESKLAGDTDYEASEYKTIAQAITQETADEKYEQKLKEYQDLGKKELAKEYATFMGGEDAGYTVDGKKVYKDDKEISISFDQMRAELAKDAAYEEAAKGAIEAAENQAEAVKEILSEEKYKENTRLINNILQSGHGISTDISEMTADELLELQKARLNFSDTQEISVDEKLIIDGIDKTIKAYETQKTAILAGRSSIIQDLLFPDKDADNQSSFKDLSLKVKTKVADALTKAYSTGGKAAAQNASAFLAQYTGDELEKVTDLFNSVDWTSRDGFSDFITKMREAHIDIKDTDNVYSNLMQTFKNSRSVIADLTIEFESFKNQIIEVNEILSDLHPGDIIDQDDLDKILAFNAALREQFVLTKEGYKFIGNSDSLKKTNEQIQQEISNYIIGFENAQKEADKLIKQGIENINVSSASPKLDIADRILGLGPDSEIIKTSGISYEALIKAVKERRGLEGINTKDDITDENRNVLKEILGIEEEDISDEDLMTRINTVRDAANETIRKVYTSTDEILRQAQAGELNLLTNHDAAQQILSEAANLQELDELRKEYVDKGIISIEDFDKTEKAFILDEVERLGLSTDTWSKWGANLEEQRKVLEVLQAEAALELANPIENIIRELDKLQKKLDDIQRKADLSTSIDSLNILQEQINLEQEILNKEKERQKQLEQNLKIYQTAWDAKKQEKKDVLGSSGYNTDYLFDKEGNINYEVLNKIAKEANEKKDLGTIKLIEELISEQNFYTKQVEATTDATEEWKNKIQEILDLKLQKFELELQVVLDVTQMRRNFNEMLKSFFEDDLPARMGYILSNLQTYYNPNALADLDQAIKKYQDASSALSSKISDAWYYFQEQGITDEAALEQLRNEALDDIYSVIGSIKSAMDEAESLYLSGMQEISDAFDKQIESYERLQKVIEHDMNIVNLLYGDSAFSKLESLYSDRTKYTEAEVFAAQQEAKIWAEEIKRLKESSITEGDVWDTANANFYSALEERNSYIESWIQNIKDQYLNEVYKVVDEFFRGFQEGESSTLFSTQWGIQNEQAERYYDTVNKTYEIRKLEAKYQDSIQNFTGNIKAQQQLNKLLQEQQKYLKEKDKLTKYDLDRANALYEVEVKRLQLEEARNRATQMQLVRDTEGNYRYQFVADQAEIDKAQQELNEAEANLWNIDKEQLRALGDEYLAVQKEYTEKIAQAANMADEERQAYIEAVNEEYFGANGKLASLEANIRTLTQNVEEDAKKIADSFNTEAETLLNELPNWERFKNLLNEEDGISKNLTDIAAQIENIFTNMSEELPSDNYLQELDQILKNIIGDFTILNEEGMEKNAKIIQNSINDLKTIHDEFIKVFDLFKKFSEGPLQKIIDTIKVTLEDVEKVLEATKSKQNTTNYLFDSTIDFSKERGESKDTFSAGQTSQPKTKTKEFNDTNNKNRSVEGGYELDNGSWGKDNKEKSPVDADAIIGDQVNKIVNSRTAAIKTEAEKASSKTEIKNNSQAIVTGDIIVYTNSNNGEEIGNDIIIQIARQATGILSPTT